MPIEKLIGKGKGTFFLCPSCSDASCMREKKGFFVQAKRKWEKRGGRKPTKTWVAQLKKKILSLSLLCLSPCGWISSWNATHRPWKVNRRREDRLADSTRSEERKKGDSSSQSKTRRKGKFYNGITDPRELNGATLYFLFSLWDLYQFLSE